MAGLGAEQVKSLIIAYEDGPSARAGPPPRAGALNAANRAPPSPSCMAQTWPRSCASLWRQHQAEQHRRICSADIDGAVGRRSRRKTTTTWCASPQKCTPSNPERRLQLHSRITGGAGSPAPLLFPRRLPGKSLALPSLKPALQPSAKCAPCGKCDGCTRQFADFENLTAKAFYLLKQSAKSCMIETGDHMV